MPGSILLQKSRNFALDAIAIYQLLQLEKEFIISKQFLRSATSIGANIQEAIAGQSKKDFYSKICIAFKEANETMYWIGLLRDSNISSLDTHGIEQSCLEIIKMLSSTKITTEKNISSKQK